MQNIGSDTGSMSERTGSVMDPERVHVNVDRLSHGAHQMVDRLAETASATAHRLSEQKHRLSQQGDYWTAMTRDYVRRHPFASVGLAVGAGMLLSLMTRRSGRQR